MLFIRHYLPCLLSYFDAQSTFDNFHQDLMRPALGSEELEPAEVEALGQWPQSVLTSVS
jgi:hypothetical protein